jgi:hypothetical protein
VPAAHNALVICSLVGIGGEMVPDAVEQAEGGGVEQVDVGMCR